MAQNTGTLISAKIKPNDTLDPIASFDSTDGNGGHHSYATLAERNSLITPRRNWGMLVTIYNDATSSNNNTYQLRYGFSSTTISDNNNWVIFSNIEISGTYSATAGVTYSISHNFGLYTKVNLFNTTTSEDIYGSYVRATSSVSITLNTNESNVSYMISS